MLEFWSLSYARNVKISGQSDSQNNLQTSHKATLPYKVVLADRELRISGQ